MIAILIYYYNFSFFKYLIRCTSNDLMRFSIKFVHHGFGNLIFKNFL